MSFANVCQFDVHFILLLPFCLASINHKLLRTALYSMFYNMCLSHWHFSLVAEILSHRMNGYRQINVKKANLLYHRPANHNESILSMTKKVHGTHLMLLGFLDSENVGDLSLIIKKSQMKELTPISTISYFQCFKLI